jgi:signal transduction histidine kinase
MEQEEFNILIIDDSEEDRLIYTRALQKIPDVKYNITESNNGEEGLFRIQEVLPSCILLDYSMPGQSGLEVLKNIHDTYPFIAIIMLTGQGDAMVAVNAMKNGAQDYMPKELITSELLKKSIQNAIEKVELQKQLYTQNQELKETNIRMQKATEAVEAANEAKNEFIINMSHELLRPMSGIIGIAQLLMTTNPTPQQEEYINILNNAGDTLLDLINNILDISTIETGELVLSSNPVVIETLIDEVITILESKAGENSIIMEDHYGKGVPDSVIGDYNRLRQIILSLASNAVKFTQSGKITISVCTISRTNDEASLRFEVADTGIGIPKDKQEYIFKKFTQVDTTTTPKYEGIGLGLSMCKTLVDMMGGTIGVISDVNSGSIFWVELNFPINHKDIQAPRVTKLSNKLPQYKANVLIAGDSSDSYILRLMLEKMGCTVDVANSGEEAVKMAEEKHDNYDIILMDCQMPKMDGYTATQIIRNKSWGPYLPIVAVTVNAFQDEKCIEAGMTDSILKPIKISDLENILYKYTRSQLVPSRQKQNTY